MRNFIKTTALLLALSLSLTACGTGEKNPDPSGAPDSPSKNPFSSGAPADPNEGIGPTDGADAPVFDINAYEYSELKDIGAKHIPIYPAVLHGGTVAKPYGTVESKEVGYTGEMEDVGSSPQSYSAYWATDSEQRLEDIPVSNADGLLMTLNSNIDAAYIFPFDVRPCLDTKATHGEILEAYRDSITAYADFVDKCGEFYSSPALGEKLKALASEEDLNRNSLESIILWSEYLLNDALKVEITPSDDILTVIPQHLDMDYSLLYSILLSAIADDIPDSLENIGPLKRLINSLDPAVIASIVTGDSYIYCSFALEATVDKSREEGIDYIFCAAAFKSMDGITFGGTAISTADDAVQVFGTPAEARLSWGPDSESRDTATAYLPYVTYTWSYAHVRITMEWKSVVSGDVAVLTPSTLNIWCS